MAGSTYIVVTSSPLDEHALTIYGAYSIKTWAMDKAEELTAAQKDQGVLALRIRVLRFRLDKPYAQRATIFDSDEKGAPVLQHDIGGEG